MTLVKSKVCTKCLVEKDLSNFGPNKSSKDGLAYYCRPCDSQRSTQYAKDNPEKVRHYTRNRKYQRHGTTKQHIDNLAMDGCNACGSSYQLHIDHDHTCCSGPYSCGECIRGVLCSNCNLALGMVSDSVERLEALIKYLKVH